MQTSDKDPLFIRQLEEQLSACEGRDARMALLMAVLTTGIAKVAEDKGRLHARLVVRKLDDFVCDLRGNPHWPE